MYFRYNLIVLSFFILILSFPILGILSKISYDFYEIANVLKNNYTRRIIFFSFYQAFLSALISCLLAIPFALSLNRRKDLMIVKIIISLCGFAFVIPSILIVFSVIKIFGYNGFLNTYFDFYNIANIDSIYGLKGILIAHILLNTPFATRLFFQNLNNIPNKYYEISRSLNISVIGNILKLEVPVIKQNLFAIFAIIFSLCFLSFAIVMALGGNPQNSTLEVAIYQYALFDLNFNKAIILSFIQIIICIIFVSIGFYKFKGSNFFQIDYQANLHPHKDLFFLKFVDFIIIFSSIIFLFSPIFFIFLEALKSNFSDIIFDYYFIKAFFNSIFISFITGILVSFIGLITSVILVINYKNILIQQMIFLFSSIIIIISPIIFSLGYFIYFQSYIYIEIVKFFIVILINAIFLLPFSILIFFNNLKNIYLTFEDYKETYRLGIINYFRIISPLFKNNFIYIFAFSTVITLGDFTIISFFRSESFETLPSYLYKLISSYRFNEASFIAGIILLISMIIYFIIDNFSYQGRPAIRT